MAMRRSLQPPPPVDAETQPPLRVKTPGILKAERKVVADSPVTTQGAPERLYSASSHTSNTSRSSRASLESGSSRKGTVLSSGSSPHRKSESKRAKKEEEESFHHHWRVGVHRHNATLYIKLPGGRVQTLKGEKEELRITVVEARGLPQMDMGAGTTEEERAQGIGVSCDPFVEVFLGDQKHTTSTVRDTLNPYWAESFVFILTDHTNERAEVNRQLCDMTKLRFEVRDWDEDGDFDFVGLCVIEMKELYTKDSKNRYQYIDQWVDLCNEDGSAAKIRPDGTPALGSIRVRGAIRGGGQIEVMNRVQGRNWLEPGKVVEAISRTQLLFQEGDREIIECCIDLINRRNFELPGFGEKQRMLLTEIGMPLGTTLVRPGRQPLDRTDEPLGLRLNELIKKGTQEDSGFLEKLTRHDPRDVYYNPMKSHWVARMEAISILGRITSRGDQRAVNAIMGTLDDHHPAVRAKSVQVLSLLAEYGDLQIMSKLIDRCDDEDPAVRGNLVQALRVISKTCKNHEKSTIDICKYMDNANADVRTTAIHCLNAVVKPGYRVAIVEVAVRLEAPSHSIKMNALAALTEVSNKGDQIAIVEVVNRLQHPVAAVRSIAMQAITVVANKGDRFALAAVGNLMEHPDHEVRRAAAQSVQLLCFPGDISAIQVVAMRLKVENDSVVVREGAKYIAAPTTGNPPGWRDPSLPQFGPQRMRADPIIFDRILTPRLTMLMPTGREAAVAYLTPILPAEKEMSSIAQMWWRDKFLEDKTRHRYHYMGPETAHALSMTPTRPGTTEYQEPILRFGSPGVSVIKQSRSGSPAGSRMLSPSHTVRVINDGATQIEEFVANDAEEDVRWEDATILAGTLGKSVADLGPLKSVSLQQGLQIAGSSEGDCTSRVGGVKSRKQILKEKMRDCAKMLLDVVQHLIKDVLLEFKDLDEENIPDVSIDYKFPAYPDFYKTLVHVIQANEDLYSWWNHRLVFPAPQDKNYSNEDRKFSKIQMLLRVNSANSKDMREVWVITRDLWRKCVTATGDLNPILEKNSKKEGTLIVTIKGACNLPRYDRFGGTNSFVEVRIPGREVRITKILNKELNPKWETSFTFDVTNLDFVSPIRSQGGQEIDEFSDDESFKLPPGLVGLYYDQRLTMPITQTEVQGEDLLTFFKAFAMMAEKDVDHIEILHSEQTDSRSREIILRIHTSDMNETIAMPGRVSKLIMQKVFVEQGILDEDRIEDPGIEVEHLTTAETLSEVSEPLEAWIRHYQLGKAPKSVGKVKLPMIPLLNSLASGDKPTLDDWFEVLTEKDGSLIRQTNDLQEPTKLYLGIAYEKEAAIFFGNDLPEGSQRAREGLGNAIRSLAVETLCKITGSAVTKAIVEVMANATIPSPDVYSTVLEALRRVAVPSHTKSVNDVVWIPGSSHVVSCSDDGAIKVWDVETGALLRTIRGNSGSAKALGVHVTLNDVIVSVNEDRSFSMWEASSGKEVYHQAYGGRQIGRLCLSANGESILTADSIEDACFESERGEMRVWGLSQPPTMQEVLDNKRIRDEYLACAQTLAACNPGQMPVPHKAKVLIFPFIERIVMMGLPADCKLLGKSHLAGRPCCAVAKVEEAHKQQLADMKGELQSKKESFARAFGLRWRSIGTERPLHGKTLTHAKLAESLEYKIEFTRAEWAAFGISGLRVDHYIESMIAGRPCFFQPVERLLEDSRGILTEQFGEGTDDFRFEFMEEERRVKESIDQFESRLKNMSRTGGFDENVKRAGKDALNDLYRKLGAGKEYEYPVWIRSLALRFRREQKRSKVTLLASLAVIGQEPPSGKGNEASDDQTLYSKNPSQPSSAASRVSTPVEARQERAFSRGKVGGMRDERGVVPKHDTAAKEQQESKKLLNKSTDLLRCICYHPSDSFCLASGAEDGKVGCESFLLSLSSLSLRL